MLCRRFYAGRWRLRVSTAVHHRGTSGRAEQASAGRVRIDDFSSGHAPPEPKYIEAYGESHALDEMTDPGDRVLVGDFMGDGYDQAMFINLDAKRSKGSPMIRIVDFNNGQDLGKVRYAENYGDRTTLMDFLDPEDVQLAANFADVKPLDKKVDQVMFINNTTGPFEGKAHIRVEYFFSGEVTNALLFFDESLEMARTKDPNLSSVTNVLFQRFLPSFFVVRAGNFRGRAGVKDRGHAQVLSAARF